MKHLLVLLLSLMSPLAMIAADDGIPAAASEYCKQHPNSWYGVPLGPGSVDCRNPHRTQTTQPAAMLSGWQRLETENRMTDNRGVDYLLSDPKSNGGLSIRCANGKLREWVVDSGVVIDADRDRRAWVRVRFDSGKVELHSWPVSTDFQGFFPKSLLGVVDKGTLKKLLAAQRALFQISEYLGGSPVLEFDVSGLNTQQFKADCSF